MRGWVRTGALIAVIALLGAVTVWVVITQHVGHLLLDGGASPWPALSSGLGTWLIIGPAVAAFLLWGLLAWAGVWTRGLGLDSDTGTLAGTAAVALGSGAAAAGAGGGTAGLVLGAVAACFLVICVWRAVRLRREVRASVAVLDERARVRAEGVRVRAEVTEVRFMHTWIGVQRHLPRRRHGRGRGRHPDRRRHALGGARGGAGRRRDRARDLRPGRPQHRGDGGRQRKHPRPRGGQDVRATERLLTVVGGGS